MNKTELITAIQAKVPDISYAKVAEVFNATTEAIGEALAAKDDVRIQNFGTFNTVYKAEHKGRNVQTQEEITVPASYKIKFKVSDALYNKVNN